MKLDLDTNSGTNSVQAYSKQGIQIAGQWYSNNLLLTPDTIIDNWQANPVAGLTLKDFSLLLPQKPEVMILGSGQKIQFPPKPLYVELASLGIGLEVMDTEAACRTFNILLSEDRLVVAAMYLER